MQTEGSRVAIFSAVSGHARFGIRRAAIGADAIRLVVVDFVPGRRVEGL